MSVYIDKAGADDLAGCVHCLAGIFRHRAHRDDPAITNAYIADETRLAGTIDDGSTGDLQIEHR